MTKQFKPFMWDESYGDKQKRIKKEFLARGVKRCPTCKNLIRTSIRNERDHGASLDCPEIKCHYCDTSAGSFWPGQYDECLKAWAKTKRKG